VVPSSSVPIVAPVLTGWSQHRVYTARAAQVPS
jgi:hypothetical protein